ncbi:PREDICTED: uncharacterized protein LOC109183149 [Ipomoea nil]|uniref:uncharacterized protein LOC109183149 n=1 Tax=Ipomoea nil TaxID=35883 RepID=UPI0009008C7C|nr:PREDICTED: uncharacterized protein LOC109183149 [Ipomoea nil]
MKWLLKVNFGTKSPSETSLSGKRLFRQGSKELKNPPFITPLEGFRKVITGGQQGNVYGGPTLSVAQTRSLGRNIDMNEVKKAVFDMKKFGSPGPDGIQAAFIQTFWEEVKRPMTDFVKDALGQCKLPSKVLEAFITLIPKKESPETASDFRPITLLNVSYKILSKVIVNRMRPIMKTLIGPYQNSFLPGRSTTDNIILTQEIVHHMRLKKGKKGLMAVKIDLHKAYDSIDWDFLESTLVAFKFPRNLIQLIMFSIANNSISLLWNGEKLPPFQPGWGLRQGDPIAPYLFILVMERLSWAIQEEPNTNTEIKRGIQSLTGIPVSDSLGTYLGIPILHNRITSQTFNYILEARTSKEIDKICRGFLWGDTDDKKKMHMVNWNDICKPKDSGGLGLRRCADFNDAFLAKLAWQINTNNDKLWTQVMKEKYIKDKNFFTLPLQNNASWGWRSVLRGRSLVELEAAWRVGDGSSLSFWLDWWVGEKPLALMENVEIQDSPQESKVSDFILPSRTWDLNRLCQVLPQQAVDLVRAVPIASSDQVKDALFWPNSPTVPFLCVVLSIILQVRRRKTLTSVGSGSLESWKDAACSCGC